jgi:mannitol-1-phosphate/altronate dehydrogenase
MREIIIIGAGAIGRGFLPWVLSRDKYEFIFVDVNQSLVNLFNQRKQYKTYRVKSGKLEEVIVPVKKAYHIAEFSIPNLSNVAAIFMNVGPRNCLQASKCLQGLECPVILCENDPETVNIVQKSLNYQRVYFAIPDVITSNTASPENLANDPLSVHTEDGTLFVDEGANGFEGDISFCSKEELTKQWSAKLYLHNTTHCIAAYLGSLIGVRYLHESMEVPEIKKIVTGAMSEMLTALKLRWEIPHSFLDWYADKEIQRFSNKLLYDPISRVAREPLRKLELEGRLIGAAQICLSLGFVPYNILTGIVSAILFEDPKDSDNHLVFMRETLSSQMLSTYILGLRKGEVLDLVIKEQFPKISLKLDSLIRSFNKEKI